MLSKLRKHFQELIKITNDGRIGSDLNDIVSSTLSKGIHYLEYVINEEEDRKTYETIQLAVHMVPKDFEANIDMEVFLS